MTAIHDLWRSIATALTRPRVLATVWLSIFVPALFVAWPAFVAYDAALSSHPGASFTLDQALDADLLRENPGVATSMLAASVFVLLASAYLAGSILSVVGLRTARASYTQFLADGGRLFLRNLRVLALGVGAALLLGWGIAAIRALWGSWTADFDAGAVALPFYVFDLRWGHLAEFGSYLAGLAFLLLVFASKVAMAHLAVRNRRSATVAWGVAVGRICAAPLRTVVVVGGIALCWIAGGHLVGMATVKFLEVDQNLWLGFAVAQIGMLWNAALLVATLLAARRFVADPAIPAEDGGVEPIVELPRGVPQQTPVKAAQTVET